METRTIAVTPNATPSRDCRVSAGSGSLLTDGWTKKPRPNWEQREKCILWKSYKSRVIKKNKNLGKKWKKKKIQIIKICKERDKIRNARPINFITVIRKILESFTEGVEIGVLENLQFNNVLLWKSNIFDIFDVFFLNYASCGIDKEPVGRIVPYVITRMWIWIWKKHLLRCQ